MPVNGARRGAGLCSRPAPTTREAQHPRDETPTEATPGRERNHAKEPALVRGHGPLLRGVSFSQ